MVMIDPALASGATVSIILITAGRMRCLPACIESLRQQTHRPIELVVVVGPSTDGTMEFIAGLPDVKWCAVDHLSTAHARNVGMKLAGGDRIAFIDDDAIASPTWLEELVAAMEEAGPSCGAVGGVVVNENDPFRPIQSRHATIDEFGAPDAFRLVEHHAEAAAEMNFLMGTNMIFRRQAILDAGGCDETFTYHYEDSDLCVAVQRAGYRLVHHCRAVVHHFPAASHNRKSEYEINYFAVNRHQMYFALKYSSRPAGECLRGVLAHKVEWARMLWRLRSHLSRGAIVRYLWNASRGIIAGYRLGKRLRAEGLKPQLPRDLVQPPFRPIADSSKPTSEILPGRRKSRLRVALLCGEFGGRSYGGVGTYTQFVAEALARLGHDVTVLRSDRSRCRIEPDGYQVVSVPLNHDWAAYRAALVHELTALERGGRLDIVEAPLWQGEGVGVGMSGRWPLVVRLETPYELVQQISGLPLDPMHIGAIAAERLQLAYASGIIGISRCILDTVANVYGTNWEAPGRLVTTIPLGLPNAANLPRTPVRLPDTGGTRFLFVGRLEARKGILELGEAFARLAQQDPKACLWILGSDNSQHDGHWHRTGLDYPTTLKRMWSPAILDRVLFLGAMGEGEKNDLYAQCDVLVAPSRYESFGLIFLEAMRFGKPVIGTRTGGVPEVVTEGKTGLLVPPEDVEALAAAMRQLSADPGLRARLGANGQRDFAERFDLYRLGLATEAFYRQVLEMAPFRAAAG